MSHLTEDMVFLRTKTSDISSIRKLNCWGCNLSDISLVRQMSRVELLSLSLNEISSLQDIQFCTYLEELFLRKNNISDINQICYLQNLPNLKILMLKDNPCASVDRYRWTVLRALPNLARLDDLEVSPEELEEARRMGSVLVHPEKEFDVDCPTYSSNGSNTNPIETTTQNQRDLDLEESRLSSKEEHLSYTMDTQNANYQAAPYESSYPAGNNSSNRGIPNSESYDNKEYSKYRQPGSSCSSDSERDTNRSSDYGPEPQNWSSEYGIETTRRMPMQRQQNYYSSSDIVNSVQNNPKEKPRPPCEQRSTRNYVSKPRRISQMNSNVLSAVLLLIKELDYSSLEIVENAVRSTLNDFEEN